MKKKNNIGYNQLVQNKIGYNQLVQCSSFFVCDEELSIKTKQNVNKSWIDLLMETEIHESFQKYYLS